MRCRIRDKYLYFVDYSAKEIDWVQRRLTWHDERTQESESLLFFKNLDTQTEPFTYWGLFELLRDLAPFKMELENPETTEISFLPVDKGVLQGVELLDFQVAAVSKAVALKKGIMIIPTGGGKTEIILGILRTLLNHDKIRSALIVVPSISLADQFFDRALQRGFTPQEICMIHGEAKACDTPIVVGVVNSVNNIVKNFNHPLHEFIINVGFLAYDESHHLRANTQMNIALSTNPQYFLAFSGSPFSGENLWDNAGDVLIYGLTGRVIYSITQKYLRELGLLAEPVIFFKPIRSRLAKWPGRFNDVYNKYIPKNQERNQQITFWASKFARLRFSVLILVQRLDHAKTLLDSLKGLRTICVFGSNSGLTLDEFGLSQEFPIDYTQFRQDFECGHWDVAIVSQVGDEGLDLPSVGCVIMGGGGKSRIKITQRLGRGLRKKKTGKNQVYIVDFWDSTHVYMLSHSKKRMKLYDEMEATFIDDEMKFLQMAIDHSKELTACDG